MEEEEISLIDSELAVSSSSSEDDSVKTMVRSIKYAVIFLIDQSTSSARVRIARRIEIAIHRVCYFQSVWKFYRP